MIMSRLSRTNTVRKAVVDTTEEFPIEEGLAVEEMERAKKYNFGFEKLEVGQSKFIPIKDEAQSESLRQLLGRYCTRIRDNSGGEAFFAIRKAEKDGKPGYRVHRVEA